MKKLILTKNRGNWNHKNFKIQKKNSPDTSMFDIFFDKIGWQKWKLRPTNLEVHCSVLGVIDAINKYKKKKN